MAKRSTRRASSRKNRDKRRQKRERWKAAGVFPKGSLVQLSDGNVGVVSKNGYARNAGTHHDSRQIQIEGRINMVWVHVDRLTPIGEEEFITRSVMDS